MSRRPKNVLTISDDFELPVDMDPSGLTATSVELSMPDMTLRGSQRVARPGLPARPPTPPPASDRRREDFTPDVTESLAPRPAPVRRETRQPGAATDASLGKAERAILSVLLQFDGGLRREQVSFLSGYSYKASSYRGAMANLRAKGYVNTGEPIQATDAAIGVVDVEPLPSGSELIDYWLAKLALAPRTILQIIIDHHPNFLTKTQLGELSGYSPQASSYRGAMADLRKKDLLDGNAIHPSFAALVGL